MRTLGVRTVSCFNGGLTNDESRYNSELFRLKTQLAMCHETKEAMSSVLTVIFTNGIDFRVSIIGSAICAIETRSTTVMPWHPIDGPLAEEDMAALQREMYRLSEGLTEQEARERFNPA